jgi:predicted acyltransferase
MILVNNPGSWDYVYAPLRHAVWHGWTPTDLVFPFFLFIVGVAISLALSRRISQETRKTDLYLKITKRTAIIFALGILLRLIPKFDLATVRIPGVLQRIALCDLFAALLYVKTGPKGRAVAVVLLLAGYWLVMKFVPVPGHGAGVLNPEGNLCSYIDTKLLGGHLYKPGFDPEGLLSTLPAIATSLLGTLTGDWLRTSQRAVTKSAGLFSTGVALTVLGLGLHRFFPINKQLWTSTFVLFTAGAALLLLALCFLLIDGLGFKKWATPFYVFGSNAIAAYVGSILVAKFLLSTNVRSGGETLTLYAYIYQHAFAPWAGNLNGSLAFAFACVLFWLAAMIPLYRKKVFIKI